MSIRTDLCDYLAQIIATVPALEDVKLVRSVRQIGEISSPTLIVKTDSFEKLPAAPLRQRQGNFTVTLISPHKDIDKAEDDLDDRLEILLPLLFTAGLIWHDATQVGYGDTNLAYDIRLTSILTNEE